MVSGDFIVGKRKRVPRSLYGTEDGAFAGLFAPPKKITKKKKKHQVQEDTTTTLLPWTTYERKVSAQVAKAQAASFFVQSYE